MRSNCVPRSESERLPDRAERDEIPHRSPGVAQDVRDDQVALHLVPPARTTGGGLVRCGLGPGSATARHPVGRFARLYECMATA